MLGSLRSRYSDKRHIHTYTRTVNVLFQIDEKVLTSSQKKDNTADRILDSLEKVAGSVADTDTQTLDTKNIKIKATRASLTQNVT